MKTTILTLLLPLALQLAAAAPGAVPSHIVSIPVACVRDSSAHSSELVSQALMGTPVAITDSTGEWIGVELPDGYRGYINRSGLRRLDGESLADWKRSARLVATCAETAGVMSDSTAHARRLSYLANGAIVQGEIPPGGEWARVTLPDGTKGFVEEKYLAPLEQIARSGTDTGVIISTALAATGAPYLWGGTTLLAPDCSGLVKRAYFASGLILPRDASQQALAGIELPADRPDLWMAGDLLFFGSESPGADPQRITHVGIYMRDGRFVHSSGRVFTSSVLPDDPLFINRPVVKAVRILGCEDTPGIIRLSSHPWYF